MLYLQSKAYETPHGGRCSMEATEELRIMGEVNRNT